MNIIVYHQNVLLCTEKDVVSIKTKSKVKEKKQVRGKTKTLKTSIAKKKLLCYLGILSTEKQKKKKNTLYV